MSGINLVGIGICTYCGFRARDIELVFKGNGQAMQWANCSTCSLEDFVHFCRPLECLVNEYFS